MTKSSVLKLRKHLVICCAGLVLTGCGVANKAEIEFTITEALQDGDLQTITGAILATETGEQCGASAVKTKVVATLEDGTTVDTDVDLGEIAKGEAATKEFTIKTKGIAASQVEGQDATFTSVQCGNTGIGI